MSQSKSIGISTPETKRNWIIIKLEHYFKLHERKSTWLTEIRAGFVTFVTIAYIMAVNASILSLTGGPCKYDETNEDNSEFDECLETVRLDLITATAASSSISCFIMGSVANLPIALAPGMGINAYFVYSVVGPYFDPKDGPTIKGWVGNYETALFAVFIEGWIFLFLSITGARTYIALSTHTYTCTSTHKLHSQFTVNSFHRILNQQSPQVHVYTFLLYMFTHIRTTFCAHMTRLGIGMFLALIGLQSDQGIGLVVSHPVTLLTLGGCIEQNAECDANGLNCGCEKGILQSPTTWMGISAFLLIIVLMQRKVKGAVFIGIIFVAVSSWIRGTSITYFPDTEEGNSRFDTFKNVIAFHPIEKTLGACFSNVNLSEDIGDVLVALMTFLYVDLLDTTGALYSMAEFGGYLDENGDFERSKYAFCTDAIGTIVAGLMGSSPITSVIESGSGIQEGGRTGITAIVVSFLFFISLFLSPIFASIPPWATGPALIVIGAMMFKTVLKINWDDMKEAVLYIFVFFLYGCVWNSVYSFLRL